MVNQIPCLIHSIRGCLILYLRLPCFRHYTGDWLSLSLLNLNWSSCVCVVVIFLYQIQIGSSWGENKPQISSLWWYFFVPQLDPWLSYSLVIIACCWPELSSNHVPFLCNHASPLRQGVQQHIHTTYVHTP